MTHLHSTFLILLNLIIVSPQTQAATWSGHTPLMNMQSDGSYVTLSQVANTALTDNTNNPTLLLSARSVDHRLIWEHHLSASLEMAAFDLKSNGRLTALSGSFSGSCSIGTWNLNSAIPAAFLLLLDPHGQIRSLAVVEGDSPVQGRDVVLDQDHLGFYGRHLSQPFLINFQPHHTPITVDPTQAPPMELPQLEITTFFEGGSTTNNDPDGLDPFSFFEGGSTTNNDPDGLDHNHPQP